MGRADGLLFLELEYVSGGSLKSASTARPGPAAMRPGSSKPWPTLSPKRTATGSFTAT